MTIRWFLWPRRKPVVLSVSGSAVCCAEQAILPFPCSLPDVVSSITVHGLTTLSNGDQSPSHFSGSNPFLAVSTGQERARRTCPPPPGSSQTSVYSSARSPHWCTPWLRPGGHGVLCRGDGSTARPHVHRSTRATVILSNDSPFMYQDVHAEVSQGGRGYTSSLTPRVRLGLL